MSNCLSLDVRFFSNIFHYARPTSDMLQACHIIIKDFLKSRLTLLESMVDIEEGKVVTVYMREPHLRLICLLLHLVWTHKALWD